MIGLDTLLGLKVTFAGGYRVRLLHNVGIGFVALSIMLTGNYVFYGIAIEGSLLLLLFVALVFMLATMAFGIFFSAWAQNVQQAIFLGFFVMFPSVIITGILVPTDNYPPLISFLSHCLPARYFAHALRAITLKGAGFMEVSGDLLFLALFFVVFLYAATRVTRPKLG